MAVAFVRQLGYESGVQLNPLRDNSEIPSADNSDQIFGIIMRCERGRIDRPFKVDRGNIFKKLGTGEQMRVNALNEAWVHVVEALNNGAYECVVQRMSGEDAKIKYAVLSTEDILEENDAGEDAPEVPEVPDAPDTEPEADAGDAEDPDAPAPAPEPAPPEPAKVIGHKIKFEVLDEIPETPFILAIKHLDCFNDGVKFAIRAEEAGTGGVLEPNSVISLQLLTNEDEVLYEFTGSLVPGAKDDYGNSYYLPDVISKQTDGLEVIGGAVQEIETDSDAYGYDDNGVAKWAMSEVLICFEEGGTAYTTQQLMSWRTKLQYTEYNYAYISSGGTQNVALLAQLAQLAFDTNRQLKFDIPGNLTVEAAIAFVEQLNMGANKCAHLMHSFWSPLKSDDPTGINPKGFFGVATLNIALCCGRNAETNAYGFAPKNFPIAGRDHPIARTNITQTATPSNQELSALARAKINPCIYEVYTGGGRYVFRDSLTCALVDNSMKKLISVADMSTSIDDMVTRYGKDILQKPMDYAVKKMKAFLEKYFTQAEASGWLVPSTDVFMEGKSFKFDVRPNEARPYDRMDVNYWLRYDGCVRQIFVTQTLSK